MIWTVLDYPKNIDIELGDLPDAIRTLDEVIKEIVGDLNNNHFVSR